MNERRRTLVTAALVVGAFVAGVSQRSCADAWRASRDPGARGVAPAPASEATTPPVATADGAGEFAIVGERELAELEAEMGLGDLEPQGLEIPIMPRTLHYVRFYSEDPRGRQWFEQLYQHSGAYRTAIEEGLREAALPLELLWLVGAESGFDPNATSAQKAAGLWQLIPAVATSYGLQINDYVDERRGLAESTRAATGLLRKLFDDFGSVDLVLAAYNAGTGRVTRAMDELRALRVERKEPPSRIGFSHLAQEKLLPRETLEYVPRIAAMAIVAANLYRFNFLHVVPDEELRTTPILVEPETRLSTLARAAAISVEHLRKLNPEILTEMVPPGLPRTVNVPAGRYNRALAVLPIYTDEDKEALDDLPTEAIAAKAPELTEPSLPMPEHDLVMTRLELASLLLDEPAPAERGAMLGDFAKLALAGQPGPAPIASNKPMIWVSGDGSSAGPSGDARIEKQVDLLFSASTTDESMGHGITLRLSRDATASRAAITVQLQSGDAAETDAPLSATMLHQLDSEVRFTDVVRPAELDVGLSLAVGRLGLLIEQARRRPAAALRARLGRHRRLALEQAQHGSAWLALSDMVFHAEHPAFGRLIDPRGPDANQIRDRALIAEMPLVRMASQATVTVAGNFEPESVRKGVAFAIASLGLGLAGREPHAASWSTLSPARRADLEADEPPLLLVSHELPPLDVPAHAASLVVLEILAGKKKSWLVRELESTKLATAVNAHLDPDWTGSVGTIAIAPQRGAESAQLEQLVDKAVRHVVEDGPTRVELAYAKAMVVFRLQKQIERLATGGLNEQGTSASRMLEALRPGYHQALIKRIEAVNEKAVIRAAKTYFAAEARYVVTLRPSAASRSIAAATP